jgi:hypothetical protein
MIRIDDAYIDTVGPDRFGQVRDGWLKLTGWLLRYQCSERDVTKGYITIDGYIIAYLSPDVLSELKPNTDFYFLPIVEFRDGRNFVAFERQLHGLLLEKAGPGELEFRRLGYFSTYSGISLFRRPTYVVNHAGATDSSNPRPDHGIVAVNDSGGDSESDQESNSDEARTRKRIRDHERKTLSALARSMEWKEQTIFLF